MRRMIALISLVIIASMLLVTPVLAYLFRAQVAISENLSTAYTMLPVMWDSNNAWMVDNGFMSSTALDTRIQTLGGLNKPHLVSENKTLTAVPIPANSQTNLYFVTGESDLSTMDIIAGYNGYISVVDEDSIELSDNFTIEQIGWVTTTFTDNYSDRNLVYKEFAFRTYISGAENVTSAIITPLLCDGFTADTWTDVGTKIVVNVGNERIEYESERSAIDERCHKDLTAISDTEWTLAFTWHPTSDTADNTKFGFGAFSALANINGYGGDSLYVYVDNSRARIDRHDGGALVGSAYIDITQGNTYYVSLERISAILVSLSIFTDAGRTIHTAGSPETLAIPVGVDTLRYLQASNSDDNADVAKEQIGWIDDVLFVNEGDVVTSITAPGVSSGEYIVKTETREESDMWATGDVLHFDDAVNGDIDCGLIYNAAAKLWISFWFNPDAGCPAGYVFGKHPDANNKIQLLFNADNTLTWRLRIGGGAYKFEITSTDTCPDDTWSHIIASISSAAGARLRINNGTAITDGDTTAIPNGGEFTIGSYDTGQGAGIKGEISNFIVGTDDLSGAEETALYNGVAPGDETDYWYLDEGTGLVANSYGSVGNAGTIGAVPTWEISTYASADRTGRLCDLVLSLDDTTSRGGTNAVSLKGISVPDNSNEWRFMQNNVMLCADNITIWIVGVKELWFEPIDMIVDIDSATSTLPDRATSVANDGIIHWGANPSGVGVDVGSMVSSAQPGVGVTAETPSRDLLPEVGVGDWDVQPDVTGALLTNPFRPFVVMVSDLTTLTELQAWRWLGLAIVFLITGMAIRAVPRHLAIACAAAGLAIVAMVVLTIFPLWALVLLVLCAFGGWISERSPSV